MAQTKTVKLKRQVTATLVPFGTTVTLPKNQKVTITQALGGSYTVTSAGAMYRLAEADADALGQVNAAPNPEHPPHSSLEDKIWAKLRTCYDPEIPINIVDLGLVYGITLTPLADKFKVTIRMTFTTPGCGMGPIILTDAKEKVATLPQVAAVDIDLVFDPPWDRSMISEQAKLELGLL